MHYQYVTEGVCSRRIQFELHDEVISHIEFEGGCNGNLKAISILLEGATVEDIEKKLRGNRCGMRPTSCADQLAIAVRKAWEEEHHKEPADRFLEEKQEKEKKSSVSCDPHSVEIGENPQ